MINSSNEAFKQQHLLRRRSIPRVTSVGISVSFLLVVTFLIRSPTRSLEKVETSTHVSRVDTTWSRNNTYSFESDEAAISMDRALDEDYTQQDIEGGEIGYFFFQEEIQNPKLALSDVIGRSNGQLLPLNKQQYSLLDDDIIDDPSAEEVRCELYGFQYDPNRTTRRRIFYGATIADDSFFTLQAVATESYNLFHTAAFVESNTTHTRTKRKVRFSHGSANKKLLQAMFGDQTQVSVDYFVDSFQAPDVENRGNMFNWQHMQKQAILYRWKRNGMGRDDIGLLADADETFSRDFLRALQICDVPVLQQGQDCSAPKVVASSIMFESSPECIKPNGYRWSHPDLIIGECIDLIGDDSLHKPPLRKWMGRYTFREKGHCGNGNCTNYFRDVKDTKTDQGNQMYPLFSGTDFRATNGAVMNKVTQPTSSHRASTGYHFHNFFETGKDIRHKYSTYGEPIMTANKVPLSNIHPDVKMAVDCSRGRPDTGGQGYDRYESTFPNGTGPIFFENPDIRHFRVQSVKNILA